MSWTHFLGTPPEETELLTTRKALEGHFSKIFISSTYLDDTFWLEWLNKLQTNWKPSLLNRSCFTWSWKIFFFKKRVILYQWIPSTQRFASTLKLCINIGSELLRNCASKYPTPLSALINACRFCAEEHIRMGWNEGFHHGHTNFPMLGVKVLESLISLMSTMGPTKEQIDPTSAQPQLPNVNTNFLLLLYLRLKAVWWPWCFVWPPTHWKFQLMIGLLGHYQIQSCYH